MERQRIVAAIAEARAHGDLSENAEYHAAKEAQS
ncbi:transcription elongation factor GreA, partial [Xanthobacter autotrophicus]|nr:transcription elongation factor GreA [Xanthobacter autotrophicus]